ncbi:MAG: hypothetical protein R2819_03780 [Allomuricauda sp.]
MKKIFYILILLVSFGGFSQESTDSDNQGQILYYGLMSYLRIKAMEFTAKEYNLEVKGVAGCVVSHELVDSVKSVHLRLWRKMDSIYGIGAKKRYEKNVELELAQIQKSYDIIKDKKDIKKLLRKEKRENEGSTISLNNKLGEGVYSWSIYCLNSEKYPEKRWNAEYEVVVDLTQMDYSINQIK